MKQEPSPGGRSSVFLASGLTSREHCRCACSCLRTINSSAGKTTDGEVLAPLSPVRRFWTQLLHLVPTTGMWGEEWLCIHVHTHSEDRRWHDEGTLKSIVCDVCILGTPCLDTSTTSMVSFGRASPLSTHHRDVVGKSGCASPEKVVARNVEVV